MLTEQLKPETHYRKITSIDKRSNLSQEELLNEYVNKSLPVVLTDAVKDWKALKKLTPAFFKENYSHINKNINGVDYNMGDFVDLMLTSTPENPAPYPYNFDIKMDFPELVEEFSPQVVYGKIDRINHKLMPHKFLQGTIVYELFLGGNGSFFPVLHYDLLLMNTQITQVYGSKHFFMYPPELTPNMYPFPDNPRVSQVNFFDPDYNKFPLFKDVQPIEITIEEGETLLFPAGWWHTTKITEPCISFGRAQLNGNNWDLFINENYKSWKKRRTRFTAGLVLLYGKLIGSIFDAKERTQ